MIQFDLAGRTAVVTGGAKGIGWGIAQRLAAAGATVAIWDQNPAALPNTPASAAAGITVLDPVNVADWTSVERALQQTLAQLGRIDILVNNAGVNGPTVPTWEYPLDAWQRVIDVDLTGVFLCCRAVVPELAMGASSISRPWQGMCGRRRQVA